MRLKVGMRPVSIEIETGPSSELYRRAARQQITELLAENRRLRHGAMLPRRAQLMRFAETLFVAWLNRRYPLPPGDPLGGDLDVIEAVTRRVL